MILKKVFACNGLRIIRKQNVIGWRAAFLSTYIEEMKAIFQQKRAWSSDLLLFQKRAPQTDFVRVPVNLVLNQRPCIGHKKVLWLFLLYVFEPQIGKFLKRIKSQT